MLDKIFKLREGVDVYKIGEDILYFYFINSREGINIEVNQNIIDLIRGFTGNLSLSEILKMLEQDYDKDLEEFLNFLIDRNILYVIKEEEKVIDENDIERYSRQLIFFQEFFRENPYLLQKKLKDQKFLIFGAGAIGSGIAIELAMMGVENFIIVDKEKISLRSKQRHFYFKSKDIGQYKVDSLKLYLQNINSNIKVKTYHDTINFNSDLSKYFLLKPSFIVNTLDEPYIGVTSLKIGRECYKKKLPLFVAGGFDAHLMSTGELIIPDKTPCVDCYINHFTTNLKDWKPEYNIKIVNQKEQLFEVGGLASMSLFSISYGIIEILKYLLRKDEYLGLGRGELLFEDLEIKYIKVEKNKKCLVCGDINDI